MRRGGRYKEYVNMGVAVDTPRGLVVPVIRDADRLTDRPTGPGAGGRGPAGPRRRSSPSMKSAAAPSPSAISAPSAARTSTPIINHPEVAVLLLGRARLDARGRRPGRRPLEIRLMLPLSLSYDHRLVDGAAAGRFLNEVIGLPPIPGEIAADGIEGGIRDWGLGIREPAIR